MLQKTEPLTPAMLAILAKLAKRRPPFSYASIGRRIPGVSRKPRGDYVWAFTGQASPMTLRKGIKGNGKPQTYQSPVFTLVPSPRKFARERLWETRAEHRRKTQAARDRLGAVLDRLLEGRE